MRFTLDELAEMEHERQITAYQHWRDMPEGMRNHPLIYKPDVPQTYEQIAMHIANRKREQHYFSMSGVVTGARRQWKRN